MAFPPSILTLGFHRHEKKAIEKALVGIDLKAVLGFVNHREELRIRLSTEPPDALLLDLRGNTDLHWLLPLLPEDHFMAIILFVGSHKIEVPGALGETQSVDGVFDAIPLVQAMYNGLLTGFPFAEPLHYDHGLLDLQNKTFKTPPKERSLTPIEHRLLTCLSNRPDHVFSKEQLMWKVWGYHPTTRSNTVATTIRRLRKKVESNPSQPKIILSVARSGYRFGSPIQPKVVKEAPKKEPSDEPEKQEKKEKTGFVGRKKELLLLAEKLQKNSMVTITGMGGVGKSQLALQYSVISQSQYPGGIWNCDLLEIQSAAQLAESIALTLNIRWSAERMVGHIARILRRKSMLLILDNGERLHEDATRFLIRLSGLLGSSRILITARQPINASPGAVLPLGALHIEEAQRLFQATAAVPVKSDDLIPLLKHLEFFPLAIVLAASIAHILPPAKALQRLKQGRSLPQIGRGRHTSLDGMFESSWVMLDKDEQLALAGCSVFHGGFELDAAEAVLGEDALFLLEALRKKSWLQLTENRYHFLSLLRDFAATKGKKIGVHQKNLEQHALYFTDLARRLVPLIPGPDFQQTIEQIRLEKENLLSVYYQSVNPHPKRSFEVVLALEPMLMIYGLLQKRQILLKSIYAQSAQVDSLDLRIKCALALSETYRLLGQVQVANSIIKENMTLFPEMNVKLQLGLMIEQAANIWSLNNIDQALEICNQALERSDDISHPWERGKILRLMGNIYGEQGKALEAEQCQLAALRNLRRVGAPRELASILGNIANMELVQGKTEMAIARYTEALQICQKLGDVRGEGIIMGYLGNVDYDTLHFQEAEKKYNQALQLIIRTGDLRFEGILQNNVGSLAIAQFDLPRARKALGKAMAIHQERGDKRGMGLVRMNLAVIEQLEGNLQLAIAGYKQAFAYFEEQEDVLFMVILKAYMAFLTAVSGDWQGAQLQFQQLPEVDSYPIKRSVIALNISVQIAQAHALKAEGKKEEAEQLYKEVQHTLEEPAMVSDEVLARHLLRAML